MQVDVDLKLDGFFSQWLTDVSTLKILNEIAATADALEQNQAVDFDFSLFNETKTTSRPQPKLPQTMVTPQKSVINPTMTKSNLGRITLEPFENIQIPTFYGPGDPSQEMNEVKALIKSDVITTQVLDIILKEQCSLPGCFAPVIIKLYGSDASKFLNFYEKHIAGRDPDERFFRFCAGPHKNAIVPNDLTLFVQSIIETHESLNFLENEPLFQEKFVDFIVTRCFYQMDTELRGTASVMQFRKYGIASIFLNAFQMPDINETHHIFNYQHFYVAFCKFWDLDVDNDGFICKDDMFKFNDSTISPLIIERFFKSNSYPRNQSKRQVIDFPAFSYFLMSSEDKTNRTSINFWYRICDLDDDGILSMSEIEQLYAVQFEQIKMTGNETIPFEDIQKQLIDVIAPVNPAYVTVEDLIRSKQADMFFNTLFDIQKFLTKEYQFPMVNPSLDEATKGLTPWETYVLHEYDQLVSDS